MGCLPSLKGLDALRNLFDFELLRREWMLGLLRHREPKPKATPKEPNNVDL